MAFEFRTGELMKYGLERLGLPDRDHHFILII